MSTTYARDEIISASEAVKSFKTLLDDLSSGQRERVIISRNNNLDVVMFSVEAYEALEEALEDKEIAAIVQARKKSTGGISLAELKQKYDV